MVWDGRNVRSGEYSFRWVIVMRRKISRFLRSLFGIAPDAELEQLLQKNREALESQREVVRITLSCLKRRIKSCQACHGYSRHSKALGLTFHFPPINGFKGFIFPDSISAGNHRFWKDCLQSGACLRCR